MNNIFEKFVVGTELYVDAYNWGQMCTNYTQEHIIKDISDAIVLFKISLPYREITLEDAKNDYLALKNLNWLDLYKTDSPWLNKFEYKYKFIDEYVGISNVGNKASDYFHQVERWKCDATGYPSPQKTWETEQYRLTLFKALFSLKVKEINPQVFRNIISLRKYIAAQFRPCAAKVIYDMFEAETVLDFSMGWGDRIAGAHASNSVKTYVGIDPNVNLFDGYVKQIKYYDTLTTQKTDFWLYNGCAEDETFQFDKIFDLIFTSPPYFDKEKYDQSELQSYKKYKGFDSWMQNFLFEAINVQSKSLKSGGHLVINISDIYTRKKLYKICDGMNDYIASTNQFDYVGAMGLRMPKRPMSISSDTVGVFAEPMWIWKKK